MTLKTYKDATTGSRELNFKRFQSEQKLRGGYYTPPDLAQFIARWVSVNQPKSVLEPSCGDGVFLDALDGYLDNRATITAFEINRQEACKAKTRNGGLRESTTVIASDFLEWALVHLSQGSHYFDAVVGNPPFIRYQYLPDEFQDKAELIFETLGCKFTKHTNAWVPFILASMQLLGPGGRLGMVVPAELIHVAHAQALRTFLNKHCSKFVILDPAKIWFSGTLQGAAILLAEKRCASSQASEGLGIVSVIDREFVNEDPEQLFRATKTINDETIVGKWTKALLNSYTRELISETEQLPEVRQFDDVACVDVGIVTGANKFFLVTDETVDEYDLHKNAYPMFGRSEHCPGVIYDERQHRVNEKKGKATNFIWFKDESDVQQSNVRKYIKMGERLRLHERYKCRVRSPWYCVPSVYDTEVGMLKRSHHMPRLIHNQYHAYTTDTAYRIRALTVPPKKLVASFMNPLTALSAELEGRHYGGGVLELVPSEIEKLLVPIPSALNEDLTVLDFAVRKKTAEEVLAVHGQQVLAKIGLSRQINEDLLDAWMALRNRRQRVTTQEADSQ